MLEPAPGLFSTTSGAPSALDRGSAKTRATKSAAPPGAKPTTSLTGREGYDCASAWLAKRKTRQKILIPDTIGIPGSTSIATLHRDYIDLCRPIAFIANIVRRKSR